MQIKVDFLCRDSILAAPIVLDLALFLDFGKRAGLHGIQNGYHSISNRQCANPIYIQFMICFPES